MGNCYASSSLECLENAPRDKIQAYERAVYKKVMYHEVVAALIIQSRMILLGHRSPTRKFYPNVWDVFGGHVEPGEAPHQTLIRELQEELGITPIEWTCEETIEGSLSEGEGLSTDHLYLHLYLVTAWSGIPVNLQPHEHDSIQWFSLDKAMQLNLAHPTYPQLFARYLSQERNAGQGG